MRAAVFRDGEMVVDAVAAPRPVAGQVLVKTLCCGICGSDLHAAKFTKQFTDVSRRSGSRFVMDPTRDVVMGHEFCCEVIEHGPGNAGALKPGTLVTSIPATIAGTEIHGLSYSNDYTAGYGEQMVLAERLLLAVPNGLPADHAALTEPMAVGWHAVQKSQLTIDDVPVVIGCGPVGLAVIAALKIKGVSPIIAADFSAGRRALAQKMGADIVIDPAVGSPYESWAEAATPDGFNPSRFNMMFGDGPKRRPGLIFECVGVPGLIQQVIGGAPVGARIVVVGVCMESDNFEPFFGIAKELNLQFVLGYSNQEFADSLRHIAEGLIDVSPLITGKVGLDGVKQAFADLANPEKHAKILVEPWR